MSWRVDTKAAQKWAQVKANPTYLAGALTDVEGAEQVPWHLHADSPRSSQVFCISAFGTMRHLQDGQEILQALLTHHFPDLGLAGPWEVTPEYSDREVLGESGRATPTSIDAFCRSASGVVCIESKFVSDAREGFGSCSQFPANCSGFYGPGSDKKGVTSASCRLELPEGDRGARSYWQRGREFFREETFVQQFTGQVCPFRNANFQIMRNVLFAASSGHVRWATMAIVPNRESRVLRRQVKAFRDQVLRPEYRDRLAIATYEELIELLRASKFDESRKLGTFLSERIESVCGSRQRRAER